MRVWQLWKQGKRSLALFDRFLLQIKDLLDVAVCFFAVVDVKIVVSDQLCGLGFGNNHGRGLLDVCLHVADAGNYLFVICCPCVAFFSCSVLSSFLKKR